MFFEAEFPRKIAFQRIGGETFNTSVVGTASGQEQRNANWADPRAEYSATSIQTSDSSDTRLAFVDNVRRFFRVISGMQDGFRFFDELDCSATAEAMVVIPATSNLQWQMQKTYSLGGRTSVRTITKPITASVIDYKGTSLANTVTINHTGGTVSATDHTTGIVTFSVAPTGTPTWTGQYHIPVRLTSDKYEPQVDSSAPGQRVIRWTSLGLIEVRPPNY